MVVQYPGEDYKIEAIAEVNASFYSLNVIILKENLQY